MRSIIKAAALVVATAALVGLGVLYYQGRQPPRANSAYVALGSSFAAGLGLGEQEPGSPLVCQRSINGYPQLLARLAGLELTDVSCSAATVEHVFHGGQMFLGPQINALGPDTRLVTITAGGNDIGYVGDLTAMAYVRKGGIIGFVVDVFWQGAEPIAERDFAGLEADLTAGLLEIRRRAPDARIVVLTYPAILPETGTCAQLGIDAGEAELMRRSGIGTGRGDKAGSNRGGSRDRGYGGHFIRPRCLFRRALDQRFGPGCWCAIPSNP